MILIIYLITINKYIGPYMAFLCKCTESQSKYQTKKVSHPNDFLFDWHFPLSDLYLLAKKVFKYVSFDQLP